MAPNKQIGWSQESILLHAISKELERLGGILASFNIDPIELNSANRTAWNNGGGNISSNTAFGEFAFDSNTSGTESTAFGYNAVTANTTTNYNTGFGYNALRSNSFGTQNTAIGAYALELVNNSYNTAVGAYALSRATSALYNTAVGVNAGKGITVAQNNTAFGYNALGGINGQNSTGNQNTVIGYQAGGALTSGSANILIENVSGILGVTSGSNNIIINGVGFSGISTGNNNVIIGGFNGTITEGSDQVIIGTGNGVRRIEFDSAGQMKISNTQPAGTGVVAEKILIRDNTGAVKTLDYVTVNATATALSSATLTSTYSTARTGFRVICMSIGAGALIYTKTSAGWASSSVTNVV